MYVHRALRLFIWLNVGIFVVVSFLVSNNYNGEVTSSPWRHSQLWEFRTPRRHVPLESQAVNLDCSKIFNRDKAEILKADKHQHQTSSLEDILRNNSCGDFVSSRGYYSWPVTEEEKEFPVAFSILMYKEPLQVERLLQTIYRPQNVYCIHVDASADDHVLFAMKTLSGCLPNVFVVPDPVDVSWGTWSVVEAELRCMSALIKKSTNWRYFINLTGQELPLKTNLELVRILKALNGSNAVQAVPGAERSRWWSLPPPPLNVTLVKGECHVAVTRDFVNYVLNDRRAKMFKEWVQKTRVPDELYFPSLSHSPQLEVPGSYTGVPQTGLAGYDYITRYKCWKSANCPCEGVVRRWMCIFGAGDLYSLVSRPEMFANKFQLGFRPAVVDCMTEWIYNRTMDSNTTAGFFNMSYYKGLPNAKYHLE